MSSIKITSFVCLNILFLSNNSLDFTFICSAMICRQSLGSSGLFLDILTLPFKNHHNDNNNNDKSYLHILKLINKINFEKLLNGSSQQLELRIGQRFNRMRVNS